MTLSQCCTLQNVKQTQKCKPCHLNKLSTPFPAGSFSPDTASSTARKLKHGCSSTLMPWTTTDDVNWEDCTSISDIMSPEFNTRLSIIIQGIMVGMPNLFSVECQYFAVQRHKWFCVPCGSGSFPVQCAEFLGTIFWFRIIKLIFHYYKINLYYWEI